MLGPAAIWLNVWGVMDFHANFPVNKHGGQKKVGYNRLWSLMTLIVLN